ncbi:8841_t:CDS:2 [Funneliformis mosseae]|uniref:8841_t:CDS:1 n=1 Tax=Funneliformis mosseae TaxID=27381 RepID=A0A9N9F2V6_FUNMO|nr:8841_t:CDS:2 [Funneliformis mosseae]
MSSSSAHVSKCEFWTRFEHWKRDLETMQILYKNELCAILAQKKPEALCTLNSFKQTKKLTTTITKAIEIIRKGLMANDEFFQ